MQRKLEHFQKMYNSQTDPVCTPRLPKRHREQIYPPKNDPPNFQVNLLSVILNDAPILPEEDDEDVALLVKDSPQCMTFGLFMIW